MENWFIIDLSGLEIAQGFYNFYFSTLKEKVHYFKKRNSDMLTFKKVLHDEVAAELLKNNRPRYNLLFIVSTPIHLLCDESLKISSHEQSVTPFIHYLQKEVKKLAHFIGANPYKLLVFELDDHFESFANFKESTDPNRNNLYYLDRQNKDTIHYQIGKSWSTSLKKALENNKQQSNLAYLLRVYPLFYFRIPLRGEHINNRMTILHEVFSFFQIIINDKINLNNTLFKKGQLQELTFSANHIPATVNDVSNQILESLNQLKSVIEEKELTTELETIQEKTADVKEKMGAIQEKIKDWKLDSTAIVCQNTGVKLEEWQKAFDVFLGDAHVAINDWTNFLHFQPNLIQTQKETLRGTKFFWHLEKTKLLEKRIQLQQELKRNTTKDTPLLGGLKTTVVEIFAAIEEDIERCPNNTFIFLLMLISFLFYFIGIWTIFSSYIMQGVMTIFYAMVSLYLFFRYRNKSIKMIKANVEAINTQVKKSYDHLISSLKAQKSSYLQQYELNNINQNLQAIEIIFEQYQQMEQKIIQLEEEVLGIKSIAMGGDKPFTNYHFKDTIKNTPYSLADYLEIYNKIQTDLPILLDKDRSPQQPIVLQQLKINALEKIMNNTNIS